MWPIHKTICKRRSSASWVLDPLDGAALLFIFYFCAHIHHLPAYDLGPEVGCDV